MTNLDMEALDDMVLSIMAKGLLTDVRHGVNILTVIGDAVKSTKHEWVNFGGTAVMTV